MADRGMHTFQEIMNQPHAWVDALQAFRDQQAHVLDAWERIKAKRVLFTGCGSTYYLSLSAASLFEALTGVPSEAHPGSEIFLFPDRLLGDAAETLLVTISRSGTTTETLQAQRAFRQHGGLANWAITCYPESPLAKQSDIALLAAAAQEESVAQTRSFTSMLILAQALAAVVGGRDLSVMERLPAAASQILNECTGLMQKLGRRSDINHLVFLGSDYQWGIANEAMLKMTEMSLSFSNAFHFLEYRHGPMSMANDKVLLCGLLSADALIQESKVLREMKALHAFTLAVGQSIEAGDSDWQIDLPKEFPDWTLPALYLPPLQLLAYYRALAKGLDPDNPRNLTAVVYLNVEMAG